MHKLLVTPSAVGISSRTWRFATRISGATLTSAETDDETWSPPAATSAFAPSDLRSLYEQADARAEQERARADAAEAHAEELRQAEMAFPRGFAEVAARQEPEQAERGHRGDEGGPPRGEGRAVLPGGSGAAGEAPFGSRRRVGQARHDRVVAQGCRPTAQGPDGVRSPEGCGWAAVPGDPSAAQGAGAVAGPDGHDRASPRGTPRVAQGNGAVEQGDRPAGRGGREAGR